VTRRHFLFHSYLIVAQISRKGAVVRTSPALFEDIVHFLARRMPSFVSGGTSATAKATARAVARQATLVKLLEKFPLVREDARALLQRVESAGFFRAAAVLYKQAGDFPKVLDSYISDHDPTFGVQVFDYIITEITALARHFARDTNSTPAAVMGSAARQALGGALGDASEVARGHDLHRSDRRGGGGAASGRRRSEDAAEGDMGNAAQAQAQAQAQAKEAEDPLTVLHSLDTVLNDEGLRRLAAMKRHVLKRLHALIQVRLGLGV